MNANTNNTMTHNPKKKNKLVENRVFHIVNEILLGIFAIACIIAIIHVIAMSFSTAGYAVSLLPRGFSFYSYSMVLKEMAFFRAYGISILVTISGMVISVAIMFAAAYPLSKLDFPFRKGIMIFFIIVMLFSGGIVPNYLVVKALGLANTPLALVLPSVVQVYHLILIKSYLEGLPAEIEESAKIDGASPIRTLISIILPLSKPMIASVCMFTAIIYWNNYFSALIYLPNAQKYYPLPMYILNLMNSGASSDILGDTKRVLHQDNIESATIILSIIPIVLSYPFLLKYFTKGVMVGAVKG